MRFLDIGVDICDGAERTSDLDRTVAYHNMAFLQPRMPLLAVGSCLCRLSLCWVRLAYTRLH
eukprot:4702231-Amphidinium_carterae.1